MLCPNCKNEIPDNSAVCDYCGENFGDNIPKVDDEKELNLAERCEKPKQRNKKRFIYIGSVVAGVVLIIVILCMVFFCGDSRKEADEALSSSVVYVSDGSLYYLDCNSGTPFKLFEGNIKPEEAMLYNLGNICVTENGEEIFYFKNLSENAETNEILGDLCVRSIKNKKAEPFIIDTKVRDYRLSEDCKNVLYEKEGALYEYNAEEKKAARVSSIKSLSDVKGYCVSSYAYLSSDGKLYEKTFGQSEKLISENVVAFYTTSDNTKIYFEKNTDFSLEFALGDYVEYDVEGDNSSQKPEFPDKSSMSEEEYKEAYTQWNEEYVQYLDNEAAAERISELTSELKDAVYSPTFSGGKALFEYESGNITELSPYGNCYSVKDKLNYYRAITSEVSGKIKLSQIDSVDDIIKYIDSNLVYEYYIENTKSDVPAQTVIVDVNDDLTEVLYIVPNKTDEISGYIGELYKASLKDGVLTDPELVDSDVCGGEIRSETNEVYRCTAKYSDGKIVYYKDYSNGTFDYYEDKQQIYNDALFGHVFDEKSQTYAYLKRPVFDGEGVVKGASLVINKEGKETEIFKGNVDGFYFMPDGSLIYSVNTAGNSVEVYKFETKRPELLCEKASQFTCTNSFYESKEAVCVGFYVADGILYTVTDDETERIAEGVEWVSAES